MRRNVVVHSKATIIDDHWLFVGSANCMRRSLYTDGEISVGVLDKHDTLAKQARIDLWGGHFGKPADQRLAGQPEPCPGGLETLLGIVPALYTFDHSDHGPTVAAACRGAGLQSGTVRQHH